MIYLLVFSLGLIAGAYCVGLMNKKIEYDVPLKRTGLLNMFP